jgi:hypothetical protein
MINLFETLSYKNDDKSLRGILEYLNLVVIDSCEDCIIQLENKILNKLFDILDNCFNQIENINSYLNFFTNSTAYFNLFNPFSKEPKDVGNYFFSYKSLGSGIFEFLGRNIFDDLDDINLSFKYESNSLKKLNTSKRPYHVVEKVIKILMEIFLKTFDINIVGQKRMENIKNIVKMVDVEKRLLMFYEKCNQRSRIAEELAVIISLLNEGDNVSKYEIIISHLKKSVHKFVNEIFTTDISCIICGLISMVRNIKLRSLVIDDELLNDIGLIIVKQDVDLVRMNILLEFLLEIYTSKNDSINIVFVIKIIYVIIIFYFILFFFYFC